LEEGWGLYWSDRKLGGMPQGLGRNREVVFSSTAGSPVSVKGERQYILGKIPSIRNSQQGKKDWGL